MIINIWKPKYHKGEVTSYFLLNEKSLNGLKGNTACKIIWQCDNEKCKTKHKLHSINASHLIKEKLNFNIQICRSCQCSGEGNGRFGDNRKWADFFDSEKVKNMKKKYSEKWLGEKNPSKLNHVKIKKGQPIINEDYLKLKVESRGFKLLEIQELDGKKSKMIVVCPNNHIQDKTYESFRSKKKFICEYCFYQSIGLNLTEDDLLKLKNYNRQVRALTAKTYRIHKEFINPKNLKIKRGFYHLDHKFSISQGYKHNVDPKIISSKENLEVISEKDNLTKNKNCSIELHELISLTKYLL